MRNSLTQEQVIQIGLHYGEKSLAELSSEYKVSVSLIAQIVNRLRKFGANIPSKRNRGYDLTSCAKAINKIQSSK